MICVWKVGARAARFRTRNAIRRREIKEGKKGKTEWF